MANDYTGYEQSWDVNDMPDLNQGVYNYQPDPEYPTYTPDNAPAPDYSSSYNYNPDPEYPAYNQENAPANDYTPQDYYQPNNPSAYTANPLSVSRLGSLYDQQAPQQPFNAALNPSAYPQQGEEEESTIDRLKRLWASAKMPDVSKGQADVLKSLAGLYSAYQGRKQAGQLREAAGQMDPFAGQRPQYQERLEQSYSDPRAFANTPESRMQMAALEKALARKDAKSGRRSQYGARAVQMQTEQAKLLDNYRKGLLQPSGANFGPNATQGTLLSNAAQTDMNASGQLPQALSQTYRKQDPQYAELDARIKAFEDAFPTKKA